jgi:hypothetical protein
LKRQAVHVQQLGMVDHSSLSKMHWKLNINEAQPRPNEKRHPKVPFEGLNSMN